MAARAAEGEDAQLSRILSGAATASDVDSEQCSTGHRHTNALNDEEKSRKVHVEFMLAATATSCACLFSNPMEVVKTRMQLQGELEKSGHLPGKNRAYRNVFHAFYRIGATEGIRGLQRGLLPGIAYQSTMNGIRLGLYKPMQRVLGNEDPGSALFVVKNIMAGGLTGMAGAFMGSPLFLVKARLQAQGSAASSKDRQYNYKGMVDGFCQVWRSEGLRGLFRGVTGALPRVGIGSATQLSTYDSAKHLVASTQLLPDGVVTHGADIQFLYLAASICRRTLLSVICACMLPYVASFMSGLAVTTAMNPFDVVSTRLYSQRVVNGRGILYSGVVDCFLKTLRAEGVRGMYKGWTANYLRLGPHTILTFVFWEYVQKLAAEFGV